ncbi:hypothetical protein QWY85_08360 [Neolewinella lacunae]|uniref:Uncharacterized protein n=1 Tax=Neolewinella lacunae TaxID=1517758 RepID=A0A923PJU1_9BACT|nr:hypothetical protein [Neolewinella lacunae]MBC6993996.1 hypothetical protein [Neolewinella lacunae]MDN3634666.1 hypothetical protein [Neolewinella lacunae]
MTYPRFYRLLALATLLVVGGATLAHATLPLTYALPLTVGTALLLLVLSLVIFWLGKRTVRAENKYLFGNVFMGVTILKLVLCGGLIVGYILLAEPVNKYFVVPFFFTYLVYTALEMFFLVKLAGESK